MTLNSILYDCTDNHNKNCYSVVTYRSHKAMDDELHLRIVSVQFVYTILL